MSMLISQCVFSYFIKILNMTIAYPHFSLFSALHILFKNETLGKMVCSDFAAKLNIGLKTLMIALMLLYSNNC